MSIAKHVPVRMCIGCREKKVKEDFIRVVKSADCKDENKAEIVIDKTYKIPGRGAYICKNEKCFKGIIKKQKLQKALRAQIPKEIILELEKTIND